MSWHYLTIPAALAILMTGMFIDNVCCVLTMCACCSGKTLLCAESKQAIVENWEISKRSWKTFRFIALNDVSAQGHRVQQLWYCWRICAVELWTSQNTAILAMPITQQMSWSWYWGYIYSLYGQLRHRKKVMYQLTLSSHRLGFSVNYVENKRQMYI